MKLTLGMNVRDVRDVSIGLVTRTGTHCIAVRESDICITREAVCSVDDQGVMLICDVGELSRYECRLHPAGLSRVGR